MAILLNDMTDEEVYSLTKYMAMSGDKLDLSSLGDNVVDKHSTGGVGDKTTLIVAPIVAACGVKVAKMSGRGLGHTGGTIDKLEAIPGFNVNLSKDEFLKQINDINVAITSQTENIALADKKIYALRDVTGTVESIPLIASSIMSKKIALGAKKLVLDIKVGEGALIKNINDAKRLANLMINIGIENGIKVVCLLTNMDIPLGNNIGNSLEVMEAIDILRNKKKDNLYNLCVSLASWMVSLGLDISYSVANEMVINVIQNGLAYNKFVELVEYQHGDINKVLEPNSKYEVKSMSSGYVTSINAYKLGMLSMNLGAGRLSKNDAIDYNAGIVVHKNMNDYVNSGDVLMTLYTNKPVTRIDNSIFRLSQTRDNEAQLIYEAIVGE